MKFLNTCFVRNLLYYQATTTTKATATKSWPMPQQQQLQFLRPFQQLIFNRQQQKQSYHQLEQQQQQAEHVQLQQRRGEQQCKQIQLLQQQQQRKQQQQSRQFHALAANSLATTTTKTKTKTTTNQINTNTNKLNNNNNKLLNVRRVSNEHPLNTDIRRSPQVSPNLKIDCEKSATEFVQHLTEQELECIESAIVRHKASQVKDSLEVKLAATQWRTRFGRPSKLPALKTVDPTGTFCAFPEDWLKKKLAAGVKDPVPKDLFKIFVVNAVPFIAFGFLDNFTMIVAGDYIELIFGRQFAISTMAAAGLGNTISDMLGIGSAYYVERGCVMIGLNPPVLTPAQMELKSVRRAANWGRLIGITIGCLVGMCPLLWLETTPAVIK